MRKADYATLAKEIRAQIVGARDIHGCQNTNIKFEAHARYNAAKTIAVNFAHSASVDKREFLKACGIEP